MAYDIGVSAPFSGRPAYDTYLYVRRDQVSGNNSSYAWAYYARKIAAGTTWTGYAYPWAVSVGGYSWSGSAASLNFPTSGGIGTQNLIASSTTGWIAHAADGTLGIQIAAWYHTGGSEYFGNSDIPATWFNTDPIATVPPAPTPLGIDTITSTSMRYRFSGNGNGGSAITQWQYAYNTTSDANAAGWVIKQGTGTDTITGLTPGTTYYVKSRGVNAVGAGPWSSVLSAKTLAGGLIYDGSAFQPARPFINVDGANTWVDAVGFINVDGANTWVSIG